MYFYVSLDQFIFVSLAFAVLGLVLSVPRLGRTSQKWPILC